MPALLTVLAAVAFFFFAVAVFLILRADRTRTHLAIAGPCIFFGLLSLVTIGGLAWEHYTPPPASVFLAQLQACADARDRSAILAALEAHHYAPVLYEKPFPADSAETYAVPDSDAIRSVSYLALRTPRVRPRDLFSDYLDVVFLFDSHRQLITWRHVITSGSL